MHGMLRSVTAEYVDDVPYVRHFIAELAPSRARLVAALDGVPPPPGADFDYCELGCAHGDTLAALAAAHPDSRFLGVDLSAAHVASAKRLARDGALENVGVLERDFGDLVHEDIGEFDYIVAHGVLSWVSPEKRRALIDFASAKLKPGGLLHVSYNTMPGWSSVEPLRQLILFGGTGGAAGETSLERARRGLEFAHAMKRAGADYFTKNPEAAAMLDTIARVGLPYVVHEYMHEHWIPMYFARVAWEMAQNGLHFVGGIPAHVNFRDAALPEAQERLLAPVTDRVTFESLKDFALNEFFRRDVFVLGKAPRSAAETARYLDGTPWGMLASAASADRVVRLPHRTVNLEGATYDALFAALAEGATTVPSLMARSDLRGVGIEAVRAALVQLIVAEHVVPMQSVTKTPTPRAADGVFSLPSVYNQMMLRRLSGDTPIVMASPVAGTGFPVSALEGLALRMLTEVEPSKRDAWLTDLVGRSVLRIRIGDRVLEDRAEQRSAINAAFEQLCEQRLAKLVELGVLLPP